VAVTFFIYFSDFVKLLIETEENSISFSTPASPFQIPFHNKYTSNLGNFLNIPWPKEYIDCINRETHPHGVEEGQQLHSNHKVEGKFASIQTISAQSLLHYFHKHTIGRTPFYTDIHSA
jgi:hypothetical protein